MLYLNRDVAGAAALNAFPVRMRKASSHTHIDSVDEGDGAQELPAYSSSPAEKTGKSGKKSPKRGGDPLSPGK